MNPVKMLQCHAIFDFLPLQYLYSQYLQIDDAPLSLQIERLIIGLEVSGPTALNLMGGC